MPTIETELESALNAIIEALDANGSRPEAGDAHRRGESRRQLRATCELWLFPETVPTRTGRNFVTRNLSFRGLSVVGTAPGPLRCGEPIEVVIAMPNGSSSHVAGTVAFCRPVEAECSEVGISVEAVGSDWIVARDADSALKRYDWFAKSIEPAGP